MHDYPIYLSILQEKKLAVTAYANQQKAHIVPLPSSMQTCGTTFTAFILLPPCIPIDIAVAFLFPRQKTYPLQIPVISLNLLAVFSICSSLAPSISAASMRISGRLPVENKKGLFPAQAEKSPFK